MIRDRHTANTAWTARYALRVTKVVFTGHEPDSLSRSLARPTWIAFAVLAVLITVRLVSSSGLEGKIPQVFQDGITFTLGVFIESLPFVVLGILVSVIVQVWLPPWFVMRFLPKRGIFRRATLSVLGVFLPVCECGNVPLARGLIARGLTPADSMTFLLAAPILNPVTILATFQVFGWDNGVLITRVVAGFLIANFVGYLFSQNPNQEGLLTRSFASSCAHQAEPAAVSRISESFAMFGRESAAIMPALVVGSLIAGFIQVIVDRPTLLALGSDPVLSVFTLMILAVVISMCSNADAFFILSLGSAFSPGSVIAFLVLGPMVDIKMIALMRTTFRTKTVVQLVSIVFLSVAVLGLWVNFAS